MLSTPRGMITSAYFFVCKTATVVETVNGKRQLYSRKKSVHGKIILATNARKLEAKTEGFPCSGAASYSSQSRKHPTELRSRWLTCAGFKVRDSFHCPFAQPG